MARRQHEQGAERKLPEEKAEPSQTNQEGSNDCPARRVLQEDTRPIQPRTQHRQYCFGRLPAGNQGSAIRSCLLARVFGPSLEEGEPAGKSPPLASEFRGRGSSRSKDGDHADLGIDRSDGETLGRQSVRLVMGDEKREVRKEPQGTTGIVSTSEGAIGRAASRGTGPQRIPREGVLETAGKQRSAHPVLGPRAAL